MNGGGPSTTTTTKFPPWLLQYMPGLAQQSYQETFGGGAPISPYPAPFGEVAPLSGPQAMGYGQIAAQGTTSPLVDAAMEQQGATIGGAYLNPSRNPYLESYYNQAAKNLTSQYETATEPSLLANAVRTGAVGGTGPAMQEWANKFDLGQNLATLGANIYSPAYQQERQLQQNAAQTSPALLQGSYIPAEMNIQAGGELQAQLQNIINTAQRNLGNQGMWPYNLQNTSIGAIGGTGNLGSALSATQATNPGLIGWLGK